MRRKGSSEELERRRVEAMSLLDQGWSQSEIARRFGVTQGAVSHWKKAYRRDGPDGIKANHHPGPKPKLSEAQRRKLVEMLLKGAGSHVYRTELWTLSRVVEVIRRRWGVQYDPSGVWHVLRNLGWSCQRPERRARERDEAAIARWRSEDWPRIKKRQTNGP